MQRMDVLWFRRIHVDFSDRHLSDRWLSRTVYGTVLSIRCHSVDWFWTAENQDPEEKATPWSNESVTLIDSYLTGANGLLNITFSSMDDIVLIVDSQIDGFDPFVDFNQSPFFRRCQNAVLLFQTFGKQSTLLQQLFTNRLMIGLLFIDTLQFLIHRFQTLNTGPSMRDQRNDLGSNLIQCLTRA